MSHPNPYFNITVSFFFLEFDGFFDEEKQTNETKEKNVKSEDYETRSLEEFVVERECEEGVFVRGVEKGGN
jgi:hypothetical protein